LLQPKHVIPVHYDTWGLIAQDAQAWAKRVSAETSAQVHVLKRELGAIGEVVRAKAIVRTGALGSLRVPSAGDSLHWVFYDREDARLRDTTVAVSAFGTADQAQPIGADLPLGIYRVAVELRRNGAWAELATASYRVAEYRPPEFLVTATTDSAPRVAGTDSPGVEPEAGHRSERAPRLLDLYCGAGTLGLALAGSFSEVIGVEQVSSAVADARATAAANGINNARFIEAPVEAWLEGKVPEGVEPATREARLIPHEQSCVDFVRPRPHGPPRSARPSRTAGVDSRCRPDGRSRGASQGAASGTTANFQAVDAPAVAPERGSQRLWSSLLSASSWRSCLPGPVRRELSRECG
jgi:hypothetical protein